MSRTYKATGINLKSMPLGESDRLLTVLTAELGLIRVVAPGSRKPNSKIGGRSGLFVVNELLLTKGRSLDKVSQAETLESYPGLCQDLAKLTAGQYLAEMVLCQALSDQPQTELLWLLCEHLTHLEQAPSSAVLAYLTQAIFHLLTWAGISPQVQTCCVTQIPVVPNFANPEWRVEFCAAAGGVVTKATSVPETAHWAEAKPSTQVRERAANYLNTPGQRKSAISRSSLQLNAVALGLLQKLAQASGTEGTLLDVYQNRLIDGTSLSTSPSAWLSVEHALRHYAQYHFDRPIRSATLVDACFLSSPSAS